MTTTATATATTDDGAAPGRGPARPRPGLLLTALVAAALVAGACGDSSETTTEADGDGLGTPTGDFGVDPADLQTVVDHPFVAFAQVREAVFEGTETDAEGETIELRVESVVRETTLTFGDLEVLVVDVKDYEDGELVEETEDYYAQDSTGAVWYLGEAVDEFEDGELVGHGGQWLAGVGDNLAGVFMPADPKVGDVFEQERAPGIAEDRSTVVAVDVTVTVPAGTFEGCIETEDVDPLDGATERKRYCPGIGLVQEVFPEGGSLDLISYTLA